MGKSIFEVVWKGDGNIYVVFYASYYIFMHLSIRCGGKSFSAGYAFIGNIILIL